MSNIIFDIDGTLRNFEKELDVDPTLYKCLLLLKSKHTYYIATGRTYSNYLNFIKELEENNKQTSWDNLFDIVFCEDGHICYKNGRQKLLITKKDSEQIKIVKQYFKKNKINVNVEFSWGATEVKVSSGLVDAIVELTETGRSLKANKLVEIATLCESTTQFIANRKSYADNWKKNKMEEIAVLLKGAIAAEAKVGLKMNVRKSNLKKVLAILPALQNPTVSSLSLKGWLAVETIIDEKVVRLLIPELKKSGASGIIEYPLNKVIY